MQLSLTFEENKFLLNKYMSKGDTFEAAKKRINDFNFYLKRLRKNMIMEKKTDDEIDQKFKEEFEKLCRRIER